jgi:DNA-binding NarL/FixJ family response regulator
MGMTAKPSPIRVLIVDDHPMLREGVAAVVGTQHDIEIVGEAENGQHAIEQFRQLRPDVTLLDLQMPVMGGIDALAAIRTEFPGAQIVVLTTYSGDAQAVRALKAGAVGYLLKSALRTELLETIRAAHAGRRHLAREVASEIALHAVDDTLSERELSVLKLVAAGKANRQIAAELGITEDTVKAHLKNIFSKLTVRDRTEAVMQAAKRGIIQI